MRSKNPAWPMRWCAATNRAALACAALACTPAAVADVKMPAVFSDHMVLQRDMPVRIFGSAQPNEAIKVALRDASGKDVRTTQGTAGPDGRFALMLESLAASAVPMTLVVEGANTVTINDVVVGEVWIAGGQSNMEWPVAATGPQVAEARAGAEDSNVRLLKAPHVSSNRPQQTIAAQWEVLSPKTVDQFSAVAFWFAKDLRQSLGVPVGILSINWGGTRAEPWTDLATLGSDSRYEPIVASQRATVEQWNSTPEALRDRAWKLRWEDFQKQVGAWWGGLNEQDSGAISGWAKSDYVQEGDGWSPAVLPQKWSDNEALKNWDGVVWYRREVEIPEAWTGKGCVFECGPIDDCDVLYFNGRAVANTVGDWTTTRKYRVPSAMVKAGKSVLALEVLDLHGEGGVTAGPIRLVCPDADNASIDLTGEWQSHTGRAAQGIAAAPERPLREMAPASGSTDPAALYHGMIAPFAGYSVRGAIWYQGESNAGTLDEAMAYRSLLPLVVRSWRAAFERPDMPFGIVSLAAFTPFEPDQPQAGVWPWLRDAQLAAESAVPNVGVITTIDVGDAGDIHPKDKRTVGTRLARWARATSYGESKIPWHGPRVSRSRIDRDAVILEFDVERPPLGTRGGVPIQGFALAGADGVFHWAEATEVSPNSIRVHSPKVPAPIEVRYAWQNNPHNANLTDNDGVDGLPLHPFRRVVGN